MQNVLDPKGALMRQKGSSMPIEKQDLVSIGTSYEDPDVLFSSSYIFSIR